MKKAKKKPGAKPKKTKKDITIILKYPDGAVPDEATGKKNAPTGPADRIRWWNQTDRGVTITFSAWPFVEPPQPIMVPAHAKSAWFTIHVGAGTGRYGYAVSPPITAPGSPPDSPAVIVED